MLPWHENRRSGQKYIKKGRIHSQRARLKRTQEWVKKWSYLPIYCSKIFDDLNKSNRKTPYSASQECLKGFSSESRDLSLNVYYMLEDQIEQLSDEQDYSTDDEGGEEVENLSEVIRVSISVGFSKEQLRDYGYCSSEEEINFPETPTSHRLLRSSQSDAGSGDSSDVDSESDRIRPVSRISISIPCADESEDTTNTGFESYYETDYESRDSSFSRRTIKASNKKADTYGHISGIPVGTKWNTRRGCSRRNVHRPYFARIHGGPGGAYSLVLAADYTKDKGEEFVYYGEGGRDVKTKKVVCNQEMTRGNLALVHNMQTGNPVRVIRSYQLQNEFSPKTGYRYDGLYQVTQYSEDDQVENGFKVFKFYFVRSPNQPPPPWHNKTAEVPWPNFNSTASEEEFSEGDQVIKHKRKKQRSTLNALRSPTPLSDDGIPPELHRHELDPERPIVYPTPPLLSLGYSIKPNVIEVKRRPVVVLNRLDKTLVSKLLSKTKVKIPVTLLKNLQKTHIITGSKVSLNSRKRGTKKRNKRKHKIKIFRSNVSGVKVVHSTMVKKRGRKPKADKELNTNKMTTEVSQRKQTDSVKNRVKTAANEQVVKRKRGRPKSTSVTQPVKKKKRGRRSSNIDMSSFSSQKVINKQLKIFEALADRIKFSGRRKKDGQNGNEALADRIKFSGRRKRDSLNKDPDTVVSKGNKREHSVTGGKVQKVKSRLLKLNTEKAKNKGNKPSKTEGEFKQGNSSSKKYKKRKVT